MKNCLLVLTLFLMLSVSGIAESTVSTENAGDTADIFSQLGSWLTDVSSDGTDIDPDTVMRLLNDGLEIGSENARSLLTDAGEYLTSIYPKWDQDAQKAWMTLTEAVSNTSSTVAGEAEAAWDSLMQVLEESGDGISEETEALLEQIGNAAGIAKASLVHSLRTVQTYIDDNKESMTAQVKDAWAVVCEYARQAGNVTTDALKEACQVLHEWAGSLPEDDAKQVEDAMDDILTNAAGN